MLDGDGAVAATRTVGVKAWLTPPTVLMRRVADQVRPPFVDLENAICSWPVKRSSCQTTYRAPLLSSTAICGIRSPVRTAWPSAGSVTPSVIIRSISIGADQVSPLSVERITAAVKPRLRIAPTLRIRLNSITRSPFGSTTIWLPIVCALLPGFRIGFTTSYEAPLSSERANQASERNAAARTPARALACRWAPRCAAT